MALLTAVFFASCASGQGSGFSREADKEKTTHAAAKPKEHSDSGGTSSAPSAPSSGFNSDTPSEATPPPPPPEITTHATPYQASITVNGRFAGTGTVTFSSTGFGQTATVTVEARSYRPQTIQVSLWSQTETRDVVLDPIQGTLEVAGEDLKNAVITWGGASLSPGTNVVLVGDGTLLVRQFGYKDFTAPAAVGENQTTKVDVALTEAPFTLTALQGDRAWGLNPDSAPQFAVEHLSFQVSGPGHALLVLSDPKGKEVARWEFPRLTTWAQQAVWTGRDNDGTGLPDGRYRLTLTGGAVGEGDTVKQSAWLHIDRTQLDRDRASLGPGAGLLWTPTPEIVGPGTVQASTLVLGHAEGDLSHIPVSTSVRFSPVAGWEVFGQTTLRAWSDPSLDSVYATFAVKNRLDLDLEKGGFRAAWLVGATAGSYFDTAAIPATDFLTTFPALRAALPVSWTWGRWTLMVTPEADVSLAAPSTAYTSDWGTGWKTWGYLRGGLSFDPGWFSLAFSGAARTDVWGRGLGFLAPAQLGLEARLPIPTTPATLTGYVSVSAYAPNDYAWYGGVGLSFLLTPQMALDMVSQTFGSP